ncbi:MAG: hypothetical protein ACR2HG_00465 [Pyrinomonadaceae bacterium]
MAKKLEKILLIIAITAAIFISGNQTATAQPNPQRTYLRLQGEYKLQASKPIVEANEVVGIHVMIDNLAISEFKHLPLPPGTPDEQLLLPEQLGEFPWTIENWKILEGGGSLNPVYGSKQNYKAPAQAPPDNLITISVDLIPKKAGDPKIILLQTLYFTENETAFYLNLPQIGAVSSKYILSANTGVKVPTMQGVDPRVAARMSPDLKAKMAQAQAQMQAAQEQSGINLSAVTSNAMALYDAPNNLTAVKFMKLKLQYNNRRVAAQSTGSALLSFSFKGKDVGTYSLNDPATGLGFMLTMGGIGVGCGNNNGSKDAPCNGSVKITSMDDKTIKGEVMTKVYTAVKDKLYSGTFYGKFFVNRAN